MNCKGYLYKVSFVLIFFVVALIFLRDIKSAYLPNWQYHQSLQGQGPERTPWSNSHKQYDFEIGYIELNPLLFFLNIYKITKKNNFEVFKQACKVIFPLRFKLLRFLSTVLASLSRGFWASFKKSHKNSNCSSQTKNFAIVC